jgi:hypothetical protein
MYAQDNYTYEAYRGTVFQPNMAPRKSGSSHLVKRTSKGQQKRKPTSVSKGKKRHVEEETDSVGNNADKGDSQDLSPPSPKRDQRKKKARVVDSSVDKWGSENPPSPQKIWSPRKNLKGRRAGVIEQVEEDEEVGEAGEQAPEVVEGSEEEVEDGEAEDDVSLDFNDRTSTYRHLVRGSQ